MTVQAGQAVQIVVHPATPDRWDDVVRVFESGAVGQRCWCQWVRKTQQQAREDGPDGNRASLRVLIEGGTTPGMIAYRDGEPVGWCSTGPKRSFGRLNRSRALTPSNTDPSPDGTWATLCFYIAPGHRGQGVARGLLQGAVRYAQKMGATAYEVYPIRTGGDKVTNDSAYPGTDQMFTDEGFQQVPSAAPRRSSQIIMRRLL